MSKLHEIKDDGLYIPEVNDYSKEKYKVVRHYADMFTTSMRKHWDHLVYVDLYAGAGFARIRQTGEIVASSALISVDLPFRFSQYIFCEKDPSSADALKQRLKKNFPDADAALIVGDANASVLRIKELIPSYSKTHTVLSFCFIDPYNIGSFHFRTIRSLSTSYFDFLILIPSYMEINRWKDGFMQEDDRRLERFLGNSDWRRSWEVFSRDNNNFGAYAIYEFRKQMVNLHYLDPGASGCYLVKIPGKNVKL